MHVLCVCGMFYIHLILAVGDYDCRQALGESIGLEQHSLEPTQTEE